MNDTNISYKCTIPDGRSSCEKHNCEKCGWEFSNKKIYLKIIEKFGLTSIGGIRRLIVTDEKVNRAIAAIANEKVKR